MSAELARALAQGAGLPLAPGRDAIAGELLGAWLPPANELSRKMSALEYAALLPITTFTHVPGDGGAD